MLPAPQTTTIRIALTDRDTVQELATAAGRTQQEIMHEAVEVYRRSTLLNAMNAGFAQLREDARAWQATRAERDLWNIALEDSGAE